MKQRKLGCFTTGGVIALLISLIAFGVSYAFSGGQMFSPGELTARSSESPKGGVNSHADLDQDCAACHPAFWSETTMTMLCLDCHQEIGAQLADSSGLHGAVHAKFGRIDCRECHTDHAGRDGQVTQNLSSDFPHELVGFSLRAHQGIAWEREVVCIDCHEDGYGKVANLLCENCHLRVDEGFVGAHKRLFGGDCQNCHDGVDSFGADFDHDEYRFKIQGGHADLACENCHIGTFSLAALQNTSTLCEACHLGDDIHEGVMGEGCGECHTPFSWEEAVFDHGVTGFLLDGGHFELDCEECHISATYQGAEPVCFACHADDEPHNGVFGEVCETCHVVSSWAEVTFDHTGVFAADCLGCHLGDTPAGHYPGQCSACHSTIAWEPANFDHSVAGAVDCLSCHTGDKPRDHYTGQCSACHIVSGWLPATFNHAVAGATNCLSCHTADAPGHHFTGQCSICHSTNAWKPASFSHTFPLDHGDANQLCELCHVNQNYNTYTCYGCHEHSPTDIRDEHDDVANIDNCVRCHWDGQEHEDEGGGGEDDDDD